MDGAGNGHSEQLNALPPPPPAHQQPAAPCRAHHTNRDRVSETVTTRQITTDEDSAKIEHEREANPTQMVEGQRR